MVGLEGGFDVSLSDDPVGEKIKKVAGCCEDRALESGSFSLKDAVCAYVADGLD